MEFKPIKPPTPKAPTTPSANLSYAKGKPYAKGMEAPPMMGAVEKAAFLSALKTFGGKALGAGAKAALGAGVSQLPGVGALSPMLPGAAGMGAMAAQMAPSFMNAGATSGGFKRGAHELIEKFAYDFLEPKNLKHLGAVGSMASMLGATALHNRYPELAKHLETAGLLGLGATTAHDLWSGEGSNKANMMDLGGLALFLAAHKNRHEGEAQHG